MPVHDQLRRTPALEPDGLAPGALRPYLALQVPAPKNTWTCSPRRRCDVLIVVPGIRLACILDHQCRASWAAGPVDAEAVAKHWAPAPRYTGAREQDPRVAGQRHRRKDYRWSSCGRVRPARWSHLYRGGLQSTWPVRPPATSQHRGKGESNSSWVVELWRTSPTPGASTPSFGPRCPQFASARGRVRALVKPLRRTRARAVHDQRPSH
jgi:hypothetical protein